MLEGLANAELRGNVLRNLPAGGERQAWDNALTTLVNGFNVGVRTKKSRHRHPPGCASMCSGMSHEDCSARRAGEAWARRRHHARVTADEAEEARPGYEPQLLPWEAAGWLNRVESWVGIELGRLGLEPKGNLESFVRVLGRRWPGSLPRPATSGSRSRRPRLPSNLR